MSVNKVMRATKPGSLHKICGVPNGQVIPLAKLRQVARWKAPWKNPQDKRLAAKAAIVLRLALKHGRTK